MEAPTPSLQSLCERLERFEGQNRRLKRCGLGVLLLAGAIGVMGQAGLVDAEGQARATLGMDGRVPQLCLYDTRGRTRVSLQVDSVGQPALIFHDEAGNETVTFVGMEDGPGLWLSPGASRSLSLQDMLKQKGGIGLYLGKEGPAIQIEDVNGFSTVAGKFSLITPKTGETRHTSAASLLLFDKEGKVLWSAP